VVQTGSGIIVMSAKDWAEEYPEIYASYMANNDNTEIHDYTVDYPMIPMIYEGMAFSKFYGGARGHTYTVQDVTATGRPHALANCFSCKTPNFTAMVNEMGDAAYTQAFEDVLAQVNESISCYNCHANTAMSWWSPTPTWQTPWAMTCRMWIPLPCPADSAMWSTISLPTPRPPHCLIRALQP
jgi:formate-dependent nitrite reductase cytochrome c552 subunit